MTAASAIRFAAAAAASLLATSAASAQISFDKLTACEDIAAVWSAVASRDASVSGSCGAPSTPLGMALYERTAPPFRDDLCFLSSPPADFVSGFECVSLLRTDDQQLLCMRSRSDVDIEGYRVDYPSRYAAVVSDYLDEARQCPASNGDATVRPPGSGPQMVDLVARQELGFVLSLGTGITTGTIVEHGYAASDPAIAGAGSVAEFVYLLSAQPAADRAPRPDASDATRVGAWELEIDMADEPEAQFNQAMANQGALLLIDLTSFNVARARGAPDEASDLAERTETVAFWQLELSWALEDFGFESVTDDELRYETGLGVDDLRRQVIEGFPFGARDQAPIVIADDLYVLVSSHAPDCAGEYGGMLALVMAMNPATAQPRDYGGIGVTVMGIGSCGGATGSTRSFMQDASDAVVARMTEILEAEP